ncbi:hypothetical protein [Lachnobacterium bovis]|uniref:Uncharacterized protein n=1 Tax=Lachnobacterium bovis TaxID=140626 RepID=A0A1H9UFE2_9FIRM|nr:hypothetical protein [Lachnobacterium bovis]SES07753.1 hypothetical protein SAMN02910429_02063 [Lachnobacterium bovis]
MNLSGFRPNDIFFEYDAQKQNEFRSKFVMNHRECIERSEKNSSHEKVVKDVEYDVQEREIENYMI